MPRDAAWWSTVRRIAKELSKSAKLISTYSVGLDHIDLKTATARNISIGYTLGINAAATAEIAMLLMLGAARRAYEGQELVRTQSWSSTSRPILGGNLAESLAAS